jgi:maltose-binding protein MalE
MKRNRIARSFFLMVFSLSIVILVLVTRTVPIWAHSLNFQATNQPERQTDDVLRIWTDETVGPVLEDLADNFYAAYQVELVVEVVDNVFNDFFQAVPLGNGPDISYFPHDRLGLAVRDGLVSPIDLGAKQAQFLDSALEAATVEGQIVWFTLGNRKLGLLL